MDSELPGTADQIRWADLLTQYKYRPAELLSRVESSEDIRSEVQSTMLAALQSCEDWPDELRKWEVVLIAVMEIEIGSIWSRDLRAAAHAELLAKARDWGITPTAIRMVSVEIDSVYQRLKDETIRIPEGWCPQSGNNE